MKKLILLTLSIFSISCLSGCTSSGAIELSTFTDVTFNSASFVYDGNSKSIYVTGAPEFATVTYEGNDKTDVGIYTVTAHVSAENYVTLDLSASLTIIKASFANIVFENQSFDYDGQSHSIYVTGAPDDATITYKNNDKTSVGVYTVTATISSPNYNTLTKTATLTIVGKEISGITFSDQTFEYDGKSHSIEISGEVPDGVSVKYTNNGKTDSGTYEVVAALSGEGYAPLELKAKLTITPIELEDPGYFYDECFLYDGQNHSIEVKYAPSYATVSYKCTNANGTNTFKEPGQYDIEATVKLDKNCMSVLKATMFIVEPANVGVDPDKTGLTIDENLTWDELHEALGQDNFTYDYYSGSYDLDNIDDPCPSDLLDYECSSHDWRTHFVTDGRQAYSRSYSTYSDPYYANTYYREVGDDILYFYFHDDGDSSDIEKFPKEAFSETVCKAEAANAFVALTRGDNGEFLTGIDRDDYYKDGGYPFIEDGKFIVLMQHPRSLDSGYRYFYEIYEFYNIGNSKVELPSSSGPSSEFIENGCPIGDYRLGGVKYRWASYGSYNNLKSYYSVELYVSYHTKVFLKPGTYTVLPFIYDKVVRAIVHYSYYNQYYNYNQSGYTFNLYIDEDGDYQGEYADLGSISRLDVRDFTSDGGVVNYYFDWNN